MTTALSGISAGGATSIGGGLLGAVTALNASSNPHKAILLLTDGVENTAPMIADAVGRTPNQLRDTHVCAVGFGTPGSLDGPKLRDLAERQGGTYRADADPLTGLDGIAFGDLHGEGPALQLHGVHPEVHEHLQAGVGLEAQGVPCLLYTSPSPRD